MEGSRQDYDKGSFQRSDPDPFSVISDHMAQVAREVNYSSWMKDNMYYEIHHNHIAGWWMAWPYTTMIMVRWRKTWEIAIRKVARRSNSDKLFGRPSL